MNEQQQNQMISLDMTLAQILSTDQQERQIAERQFVDIISQNVNSAVTQLLQSIQNSTNEDVCSMAVVLMQTKILSISSIRDHISPQTQQLIKSTLQNLPMSKNFSLLFLKRLANLITLSSSIHGWGTDMLNQTIQWINCNSSNLIREFGLHLLSVASEQTELYNIIVDYIDTFLQLLNQVMQNEQNLTTKIYAIKTTSDFIKLVSEDDQLLQKFQQLIPTLLSTLNLVLEQGANVPQMQIYIQQSLESLVEMTEFQTYFWKPMLDQFCQLLLFIINGQFNTDLKCQAVEILQVICFKLPDCIKGNAQLLMNIFMSGLTLCQQIEYQNDLQLWFNDLDFEEFDLERKEQFNLGRRLFSQLSKSLGPKNVKAFIQQVISENLNLKQDEQWVLRHTSFAALSALLDDMSEHLEEHGPVMIQQILQGCVDNHPRVKHFAMYTLAKFIYEFGDEYITFSDQIMSYIIQNLDQSAGIKLNIVGLHCLIEFCRHLVSDDDEQQNDLAPIEQYIPQFLPNTICNLLNLSISSESTKMQQVVFSTIQMLSSLLEKQFLPYQSCFVPGLKQIIKAPVQENDTKKQQLREQCICCLSDILLNIGQDCKQEALELVQTLCHLTQNIPQQDIAYVQCYLKIADLSQIIQDEFMPFLPNLVIDMLNKIAKDINPKLIDNNAGQIQSATHIGQIVKGDLSEPYAISVNVFDIQNKMNALDMMYKFWKNLDNAGILFNQWVQQILTTLSSITESKSTEVTEKVLKCFNAITKKQQNDSDKLVILNAILPKYQKILLSYNSFKFHMEVTCKQLYKFFDQMPNQIPFYQLQVENLCEQLEQVIKNGLIRKNENTQEINRILKEGGMSEGAREQINEDMECEANILNFVMKIIFHFIDKFKDNFIPLFRKHFKNYYGEVLESPNSSQKELVTATCLFADYIENTRDILLQENGTCPLLERFISMLTNTNCDIYILYNCLLGIGHISEITGKNESIFNQNIQIAAIQYMANLYSLPDKWSEKRADCTDTLIGAIGRVVLFQQRWDLLGEWLDMLPSSNEKDEAKKTHRLLIQFAQTLMQAQPEKFSHIIAQLKTENYQDCIDEETRNALQNM